jgi:hypothetical protein
VIITVDLTADPPVVGLREPEDCKRFHVEASGGAGSRLGQTLESQGVGRLAGDDAMITIDSVRQLAAGRVPDGWEDDFGAMVAYAGSKGWLDETGTAIQAHVEWVGRT